MKALRMAKFRILKMGFYINCVECKEEDHAAGKTRKEVLY